MLLGYIVFISAYMNTELVSFSKPMLIDSVIDAIVSNKRVLFDKQSTPYPTLKAASEGTDANQLYQHALNQ